VPDPISKVFARLERFGTAAENTVLVLLLTAMIVLAVGQIVLREFFDTGIIWSDELVKLLVLWIAMLGSIAASRDDRHLRIDVLSHALSEKMVVVSRLIVELFAAIICGVVAFHAYRWLQIEVEYEDTVLIDFPAWLAHGKRAMQLIASRDQAESQ
jgi:TRAP-type C4-dicarboxylate transport system permease small subunit